MPVPALCRDDACEQIAIIRLHMRVAKILAQSERVVETVLEIVARITDLFLVDRIARISIGKVA